jgi:hypothetical protein
LGGDKGDDAAAGSEDGEVIAAENVEAVEEESVELAEDEGSEESAELPTFTPSVSPTAFGLYAARDEKEEEPEEEPEPELVSVLPSPRSAARLHAKISRMADQEQMFFMFE